FPDRGRRGRGGGPAVSARQPAALAGFLAAVLLLDRPGADLRDAADALRLLRAARVFRASRAAPVPAPYGAVPDHPGDAGLDLARGAAAVGACAFLESVDAQP